MTNKSPLGPAAADHARAMAALENTGLVVGTGMALAMEEAMQGLAQELGKVMTAVGGALAGALGGTAGSPLAKLPEPARRDLLAAVANVRGEMKMDAQRRDAAAARLTPALAAEVLAAAREHLAGLPDVSAPLSDEQLAGYVGLGAAGDERWSAYMSRIMPVMQQITAPGPDQG
jgi:hypothetical protein